MIGLHPEILSKDGTPQFAVLPYNEFIKIEEMLRSLAGGVPAPDPCHGGFWDNLSAEELARRQGVKSADRVEDLYGGGDPADWEGFDEALEQWRSSHEQ